MFVPAIILAIIFTILAIIHFNWTIGGTWGYEQALPTNEQGERILNPRKIDCFIVGVALLILAILYLSHLDIISIELPHWINITQLWAVPIIFILRAMGEFKYVGFFKKVKHTTFGRMDTLLFSPLCLVIALLGAWVLLAYPV